MLVYHPSTTRKRPKLWSYIFVRHDSDRRITYNQRSPRKCTNMQNILRNNDSVKSKSITQWCYDIIVYLYIFEPHCYIRSWSKQALWTGRYIIYEINRFIKNLKFSVECFAFVMQQVDGVLVYRNSTNHVYIYQTCQITILSTINFVFVNFRVILIIWGLW